MSDVISIQTANSGLRFVTKFVTALCRPLTHNHVVVHFIYFKIIKGVSYRVELVLIHDPYKALTKISLNYYWEYIAINTEIFTIIYYLSAV